tara:strand:- start:338 stop:592 length:255 start_codon:yes stop_codon:yes gene_type:complete
MPEIHDELPKRKYVKSETRPLAERMGFIQLMDKYPGKWVKLLSVKRKKRQKIYNLASYFRRQNPYYDFKSISVDDSVNLYGRKK